MTRLFRHKWMLLGLLVALLVAVSIMSMLLSVSQGNPHAVTSLIERTHRWSLYLTAIRLFVVVLLLTVAYPLTHSLIVSLSRHDALAERIRAARYRVLLWYLIIEVVFVLSHIR